METDPQKKGLRLNKFIAYCGIATRSDATAMIKKGEIMVNGTINRTPFYVLTQEDVVTYHGKTLELKQTFVYLLINKPRNTPIFKSADYTKPCVVDFVKKHTSANLLPAFPMTSLCGGLLIMTNDQQLIDRLSNPENKVKSIYHVSLDKKLTEEDCAFFKNEANLLHHFPRVNQIYFDDTVGENADMVVETSTGKDEALCSLIETKSYKVLKIDRNSFGNLTKKDLKRGWSRPLTEKEVIFLKYFN